MRPEHTQKFLDSLGTVKVSQALPILAGQSAAGTGLQARQARAERARWNNLAHAANAAAKSAAPRLVKPAPVFVNAPRFAA